MNPWDTKVALNYILTISFLWIFSLHAQTQSLVVLGHVLDSDNFAIGNAVVLEQDLKQEFVSYATTDQKGFFSISLSERGHNLKFQAFGYIDTILKFDDLKLVSRDTLSIVLQPLKVDMEGIVIRENKYDTFGNNDTITVDIQQFIDSTETTLEDLISKIPGIRVSDDGEISINGKPIKKVLIEGDDLFSKQYKLLTRNLSADHVQSVDIIQRFVDNPLYKGFVDSDEFALDITLKKKKGITGFGSISPGFGTNENHEHSVNIGVVAKKMKLFLPLNYNTTGEHASKVLNDQNQPNIEEILSGFSWRRGFRFRPFERNLSKSLILSSRYHAPNITQFYSLGGVMKPNQSNSLAVRGIILSDNLLSNKEQEYILRLEHENALQNIVSSTNQHKEHKEFELSDINSFSTKTSLETQIKYFDEIETYGDIETVNKNLLRYQSTSSNKGFELQSRLTYKPNNQQLLTTQVFFLPTYGNTATKLITSISHNGEETLRQKQEVRFIDMGAKVNFVRKNEHLRTTLSADFLSQPGSYNAISESDIQELPLTSEQSQQGYSYGYGKLGIKLEAIIGRCDIKAQGNVFYQAQKSPLAIGSLESWRSYPEIRINYKIPQKGSLSFGVYSRNVEPNRNAYFLGALTTNFRTIRYGVEDLFLSRRNAAYISYRFNNWNKGFMINGSLIYAKSQPVINYTSDYDKNYTLNRPQLFDQYGSVTASMGMHKFISIFNGTSSLLMNHSQSTKPTRLNDVFLETRFKTSSVKVSNRVSIRRFTNTLSFTSSFSNVTNTSEVISDGSLFINYLLANEFKYVSPSKREVLNLLVEVYADNGQEGVPGYFSTIKYQRKIKNSKWKINIEVFNLFNNDTLTNTLNTDISTSRSVIRLSGRSMLVSAQYLF